MPEQRSQLLESFPPFFVADFEVFDDPVLFEDQVVLKAGAVEAVGCHPLDRKGIFMYDIQFALRLPLSFLTVLIGSRRGRSLFPGVLEDFNSCEEERFGLLADNEVYFEQVAALRYKNEAAVDAVLDPGLVDNLFFFLGGLAHGAEQVDREGVPLQVAVARIFADNLAGVGDEVGLDESAVGVFAGGDAIDDEESALLALLAQSIAIEKHGLRVLLYIWGGFMGTSIQK